MIFGGRCDFFVEYVFKMWQRDFYDCLNFCWIFIRMDDKVK